MSALDAERMYWYLIAILLLFIYEHIYAFIRSNMFSLLIPVVSYMHMLVYSCVIQANSFVFFYKSFYPFVIRAKNLQVFSTNVLVFIALKFI